MHSLSQNARGLLIGLWSHMGGPEPGLLLPTVTLIEKLDGFWRVEFPQRWPEIFNKLPRRSFPLLSSVECFCSRPVQCVPHSGEEFFVIKRLHEKCDRANGHGSGPSGQIFTRSDDNHFCARRNCAQSRKQFQTGHLIHPDVSHDHRHMISTGVCKKIFCFIEWPDLESFGREQVMHRLEHRRIVIHDAHLIRLPVGRFAHAAALLFWISPRAAGSRTTMRAPRSEAFSPVIVPPCASMIDRTMARPMPIPFCFVEKKWSKTLSGRSFGNPIPKSRTITSATSPLSVRVLMMTRRSAGGSCSIASSALMIRFSSTCCI